MKIEKLTEEQIARFPEFVKKWTDIGLSTEPANRKEAEEGVIEMYKIAGLSAPKIVWCDSPFSQLLTSSIILKLKEENLDSVRNSVVESMRNSVWESVRNSVENSVWNSMGRSVRDSVWNSMGRSVRDSVEDSVRNSVENSVWNNVRNSVENSVWNNVRDSVWDSVGNSVRNSVWNSVGNSVWESVRDSVRDSVSDSGMESVGNSGWDSGYGEHDSGWLSFYDFFREVCDLKQETKKLNGLFKIAQNAGWYLPYNNICWITERHNKLFLNKRGQLHNENGMALQYPDGWGIYALNGVRFNEELYKKVVSKKMVMKDIMAIVDVDQRTQAMKYGDFHEFAKIEKAIMLDKHNKSDINGDEVKYELWLFPKGNIFQKDVHFMWYTCPSTKNEYVSGVWESKTVAEAMSRKQGITEEMWIRSIPLINES